MNLVAVGNHLWQSTTFAAFLWLLIQSLKKNSARVRYSIWTLASLKFLLPFSLLIALGGHLSWPEKGYSAVNAPVIKFIGQPFGASPLPLEPVVMDSGTSAPSSNPSIISTVMLTIWLLGVAVVVMSWLMRMWRVWEILGTAHRLHDGPEIEAIGRVKSRRSFGRRIRCATTESVIEPGVYGILRPIVLLPSGVGKRLDAHQLDTILDHELCHIRFYDNLSALIHMTVEAVFWFYPLVWWMGSRLLDERERACDEGVVANGGDPKVYASAILKICEFYVASPVVCVAGVTSSDLKGRLVEIMMNRRVIKLSLARKTLLAAVAAATISVPILIGSTHEPQKFIGTSAGAIGVSKPEPVPSLTSETLPAPTETLGQEATMPIKQKSLTVLGESQAASISSPTTVSGAPSPAAFPQTAAASLQAFEVVSIKPSKTGASTGTGCHGVDNPNRSDLPLGRCIFNGITLKGLINLGFNLGSLLNSTSMDEAITGGPPWANSDKFDIEAKAEDTAHTTRADFFPMIQAMLTNRFQLRFHREPKEVSGYVLIALKEGPKLRQSLAPDDQSGRLSRQRGALIGDKIGMGQLAQMLSSMLTAPVQNQTDIVGFYDFSLKWQVDSDPNGPPMPASADAIEPELVAALRDQLGLRLIRQKVPVEVFAIDHAEEPIPN